MGEDFIRQWESELRPGVYRSLGHYRKLAQSGDIAQPEHWPGLIDLLDLMEEFLGNVDMSAVESKG